MTFSFFFFNDTATTEIYTLSLHDALPISVAVTALVACRLCGQSSVFACGGPTTRSAQPDKIGASESTPHKRKSVDNTETSACIPRKHKTANKIDTVGSSQRTRRVDRIGAAGSTPHTHRVDRTGTAGSMLRKREGSRTRSPTGGRGRNHRPRPNRRNRNTAHPNQTRKP